MTQATRADSPTKLCTADECDRPLRAKGFCAYHYRRHVNPDKANVPVECPTCGQVTMKRDTKRRFCSLICRDVWRIETNNNPAPSVRAVQRRRICRLKADHPVRLLMREQALESRRSPLVRALAKEDWNQVLVELAAYVVQVDGCWLWPGERSDKTYGRLKLPTGRRILAHRMARSAADGAWVPPHMPVHHACAEPLCVNPSHLQVVTPEQNTAEMMERSAYQRRISDLEAALSSIAPSHPLLGRPGMSPAA